jgi:DNA adenine methylase
VALSQLHGVPPLRETFQVSLRLPHPIPYQGSKRNLAPLIGQYIPTTINTWYEPFAGSAAMTIWAACRGAAKQYVIAEKLRPIAELWIAILTRSEHTARQYETVWKRQLVENFDYYNRVRDRYNSEREPVDLLYLICRCVKNAVRFNRDGNFTQSVDRRRLGMRPEKMRAAIRGASQLLSARTEVRATDWTMALKDAKQTDFVYMDPPYLGTTIGRDKRYAEQLPQDRLIEGLRDLRNRNIRFALSYDGMTGNKVYGPTLPDHLGLTRLLLHAGISSQATLNGQNEETIESLYLSPGLAKKQPTIIRPTKTIQEVLPL